MSAALLTAERLTRRFGGLTANLDVNLALERGRVHALLGPNGAGKSTFINMLSGELAPSAGRVLLRGRDISGLDAAQRSRAGIGRSYQRTNIFRDFSVLENCRLAAQSRSPRAWQVFRDALARRDLVEGALAAIARAGLAGRADRMAGTLSHGEQRQLEIAMVLATGAEVLLLDEPLAGMGAEESARMVELLKVLRPDHAILLVEHDMDAVFELADLITVLVGGQVLACGAPAAIRADPQVQQAYLGEDEAAVAQVRGMNAALIEASGLHAYYGSSHVLHGIDFRVAPAQAVGLLGRNGMGKTTLIRSLLGLLPPRAGSVRVRGEEVAGVPAWRIARRGIAYVPEGRGIFPNLSVRENLVMAARAGTDGRRGWDFERVMATFPRLAERLAIGGAELSGGEQQMLTIGRALMTNPDLLILDEATEGLAPMVAREIWRIVRSVGDSGIATVIVDKNHRAVSAITERSVILLKGRVVFEGPSRLLRDEPELASRHLGV